MGPHFVKHYFEDKKDQVSIQLNIIGDTISPSLDFRSKTKKKSSLYTVRIKGSDRKKEKTYPLSHPNLDKAGTTF